MDYSAIQAEAVLGTQMQSEKILCVRLDEMLIEKKNCPRTNSKGRQCTEDILRLEAKLMYNAISALLLLGEDETQSEIITEHNHFLLRQS